jgi:hypothetical protein
MAAILDTQVLYNNVIPAPNSLPDYSEITTVASDPYEVVSKGYTDSKVNTNYANTSGFMVFSTRTGALANVMAASCVPYTLTRVGNYYNLQIEKLDPLLATLTASAIVSGYPIPFGLPEQVITTPVMIYNNGAKLVGELSVDTLGYVRFRCPALDNVYWTWTAGRDAGWMGCTITWSLNNAIPPPH